MKNYILAILLTTAGAKAEISRLEALSLIESGDNDAAIGSAGEVSRFQILPHVWAHYSRSRSFRDCRVSTHVASTHLQELSRWFEERTGRPASDFDVYVLWNAGPSYYARRGFKAARVSKVISERASRYARLRRTIPARRQEAVVVSTARQQPLTAAVAKPKPVTLTVASRPTVRAAEPLWPVFTQPFVPVRPVSAFALTPAVVPTPAPTPAWNPPYTLGTFILPSLR